MNGLTLLDKIAASVEADMVRLTLHSWVDAAQPLSLITVGSESELRAKIAAFVYANYYAYDADLLAEQESDQMIFLGYRWANPGFVSALQEANPGTGYFSDGWILQHGSAESDKVVVQKNGIFLTVSRDRHLPAGQRQAQEGAAVSLRFPNESRGAAPGFYLAYGDAGPAHGKSISRIYVNLDPAHATAALRCLSELIDNDIPYTWKMTANPDRFARRDNSVLYVARQDYPVAADVICRFANRHPQAFQDGTPSFALPIRPGVAVADDPSGDEAPRVSFGEHRSGLVADAIAQLALEAGAFHTETLREALEAKFRSVGLDPSRPYLRSESAEDYEQRQ